VKQYQVLIVAVLAVVVAGVGRDKCAGAMPMRAPAASSEAKAPAGHQGRSGKVVETMNSGGYTYIQVDTGDETIWAAAPEFDVSVGDLVEVPKGSLMADFHSKTMDRAFDEIYFVSAVTVKGTMKPAPPMPKGHGRSKAAASPGSVDLSGITKAEGGKTVGQLFEQKARLAGTMVAVRGKVVKFTAGIMGKNWIHLRDGTGDEGANDLTVTTDSVAEVGNTILVNGTLSTDRDFGFGYTYKVMIEDAQITVESRD
jgi:hypothetical protein